MKKYHLLVCFAVSLSFILLQSASACSLNDLSNCDRLGLISLIREMIMNKKASADKSVMERFQATEIVFNNLPESLEFWTQADCPLALKWGYEVPRGYYAANCTKGEKGSHGGCSTCIMSKIELRRGEYGLSSSSILNNDYGLYYPNVLDEAGEEKYSINDTSNGLKIEYPISLDYLTEAQRKSLSSVDLEIIIDNEIPCSIDGLKGEHGKYVVISDQVGGTYIGDYYFDMVGGCDSAMHSTYCSDYYIGKVRDGNCAIVKKAISTHSCAPYGEGMCEYVEYQGSRVSLELNDIFASIRFVK